MKFVQPSTIISDTLISSGVAEMKGGESTIVLQVPITNRISSPWNVPILSPLELRLLATRSNRYRQTGRPSASVRCTARLCARQSMCASLHMAAEALNAVGKVSEGTGYSSCNLVKFAHGKFKLLLFLEDCQSRNGLRYVAAVLTSKQQLNPNKLWVLLQRLRSLHPRTCGSA